MMRILLLLTLFFAGHTLFAQRQTTIDSLKISIEKLQKTIDSQKAEIQQIEIKAANSAVVQISGWWYSAMGTFVGILTLLFVFVTVVFVIKGFQSESKITKAVEKLEKAEAQITTQLSELNRLKDKISDKGDQTFDYFSKKREKLDAFFESIQKEIKGKIEEIEKLKLGIEVSKSEIDKTVESAKSLSVPGDINLANESFNILEKITSYLAVQKDFQNFNEKKDNERLNIHNEAVNNFADVLKDLGEFSKAIKFLDKIPNEDAIKDAYVQGTYAEIYFLQGNFPLGCNHLALALELGYPIREKIKPEIKAYSKAIENPQFVQLLTDKGLKNVLETIKELILNM